MSGIVQPRAGSEASGASEASEASDISLRPGAQPGRPIGVSPSPKTETAGNKDWWQGNRWPPVEPAVLWPPLPIATPFMPRSGIFPERAWTPEHWASVVLAEAVTIALPNGSGPAWQDWPAGEVIPRPAEIKKELKELEDLIEYRPAVLAEALAQKDAVLQYFSGILTFGRRSHPATVYLCIAGLRVASFLAMHWKDHFNRVRPSRLSPSLMPPIDPPGHAAFPSGHATQAHLLALLLEQVMPPGIVPQNREHGPLYLMAERIGRNREVLGLHYPSDTKAGKALAAHIAANILLRPEATKAAALIGAAKKEWGRP